MPDEDQIIDAYLSQAWAMINEPLDPSYPVTADI